MLVIAEPTVNVATVGRGVLFATVMAENVAI
jgi:hypothetical protein